MAQRRMFSLKIIDTDLFVEMPTSSQLLYFHLSMRADDDGFISSPKKITKMVSCSGDDLKLLIAKQFIIPFESGVCVIKDWKIHNYIAKDRYQRTQYIEESCKLQEVENGSYTLCEQNVDTMLTQDRLGKDRLGKVSIYSDGFESFYREYPNPFNKEQTYKNYVKAVKEDGKENITKALNNYLSYLKSKGDVDKKFIVRSTNFLGQKKEYKGYIDYVTTDNKEPGGVRINEPIYGF